MAVFVYCLWSYIFCFDTKLTTEVYTSLSSAASDGYKGQGSGQLELDFGLRQRIQVIAAQRLQNHSTYRTIERQSAVVVDLRVHRTPDPNAAPLRICADTFVSAHAWPVSEPTRKTHWTRRIAGRDRTRLAMALQLIRQQKAAWRAELALHREPK